MKIGLGSTHYHNPNPMEALEVSGADHTDIIKLEEGNEAEEERRLRTIESGPRSDSMETTEEELVAQKVAIREGMRAAQQSGDLVGVSVLYSVLYRQPPRDCG